MTAKKIMVVGLSKERRGGVATVLSTLDAAGFFDEQIVYHSSCGDGSKWDKLFSAVRQWCLFLRFLQQERPALAHIHFSSDMSFWRKVPYIFSCRFLDVKLLLHIHPSHFWDYWQRQPRWIERWMRSILRKADAIAFANPAMMNRYKSLLPDIPMLFLPNPIDLQRYPFSEEKRKEQVLFLGALLKGKGVYDVLRAVPLLAASHPHLHFVLCGDHEVEKLEQAVQQQNLTRQVKICSWVGYPEKLALLHESAILILPSYSEGFPVVVLEAMATGVPVIATPVGGLPTMMQDGEQLLFTEPRNPAMLARQIERLLTDDALQRRLVRKGLEYVQHHNVQLVMACTRNAYRTVMQGMCAEKGFDIQTKNL
jgi:glycosyltransferase involved in cell wall biosynthesis